MSLLGFLSLFSCSKAGNNNPKEDLHIASLGYSYHGSIGGDSYSYEVTVAPDSAMLTIEEMLFPEYGTLSCKVDSDFIHALETLCVENDIRSWNGFNEANKYVLDGDGFSLYITLTDGKTISAHGSNAYPQGYGSFREGLRNLIAPFREHMQNNAKQKIIDRGLNGELQSMMIVFHQQGSSGFDKYDILITHEGVRNKNFDVRIHSNSGEIFPKGDYNYYQSLPDKAIQWDVFERLFHKHNIIRWYNYDKAAKDYNNSEWFQFDIGFSESNVSAMGTEHPEGYDEFRHDFLVLLKKIIDDAEKKYGLESR